MRLNRNQIELEAGWLALATSAILVSSSAATAINLSGGEAEAAAPHTNDVQIELSSRVRLQDGTEPYVDAHHDGTTNPCRDDRMDYCCDFMCSHCGPRDYCVHASPFHAHSGVCNPEFQGGVCENYYVEADEPIRGHPHSGGGGGGGGSEATACVDTGFVCYGETEGSTDYCQGWASDSACQRGSCVQPASCVEAGSGSGGGGDEELLVHDGYAYRTIMDGISVDTSGSICHTSSLWLPIPDGYEIAPDTPEIVRDVIAAHRWSTDVMVVGSLKAYGTASFIAGLEYGDHQDKAVSQVRGGETVWSCPWTCYQILVRRPATSADLATHVGEREPEASSSSSSSSPCSFDEGDSVQVKASVQRPRGGWGAVEHGMCGTVTSMPAPGSPWLRINFDQQRNWAGVVDEMEPCGGCSSPPLAASADAQAAEDSEDDEYETLRNELEHSDAVIVAGLIIICVMLLVICCMGCRIRRLRKGGAVARPPGPLVMASAVRRGSQEGLVPVPAETLTSAAAVAEAEPPAREVTVVAHAAAVASDDEQAQLTQKSTQGVADAV
jgi:hypothetical protein